MDKQPLLEFIQNSIPDFKVSRENLGIIAEQFEAVEFAKHDYLLKEGKISGYFFLEEGFMRAFTFDAEGNEITTYFFTQGRVVFEPSSMFLHTPSSENIQAVTHCRGYLTNFCKLDHLFHSIPEFREFGRAMLVREFVAYKQHTLAMINKTAEERYASLIENGKEIFMHAQLKHIASFLGMTDTSLSRIRREFSAK
jgi:CRP-like cAMP-binding protein